MTGPDGTIDAIVEVSLHPQPFGGRARFERAVRRCPEVRECLLMTHDMSYRLRVRTRGPESFEVLRRDLAERLPGVRRMQASFVLRDVCDGIDRAEQRKIQTAFGKV
ncbi:Lrp/AsnC ligand binding domain-containing protein [Novosphingobium sp. BL-8A]|uniref:Lrp/AsnC ligand binding domain-containing protein n=1 Tax=Novosphingobium sp. BL-8A TaxID=3127639 RepID=UPI00375719BE